MSFPYPESTVSICCSEQDLRAFAALGAEQLGTATYLDTHRRQIPRPEYRWEFAETFFTCIRISSQSTRRKGLMTT